MAFNAQLVTNAFTGAATAYAASGAATTSMNGSNIALNTVTAGTVTSTAGLVIPVAGPQWNIEWESLSALVQFAITTNTITVTGKWQGSLDGSNWSDILGLNSAANVTTPAAGTGSLVKTTIFHAFSGMNPGCRYIRYAVVPGVTTGGSGDSVIASYCFRKRWNVAA